jgi:uncharacterized membrane protein YvlD (DUF360 family)
MTYFKSLLINFLTVFFVNHIIPGVDIAYYSKLPHIGGDLIFAFSLGFINSLVFPFMKIFGVKLSHLKIGLATFFISVLGYSIVNVLPFDIHLEGPGTYIWCVLVVWAVAYFTNHIEYRHYLKAIDNENKNSEEKK